MFQALKIEGKGVRAAGKGKKMDSPLESPELNVTHQHLILTLKTHFGLWTYRVVRYYICVILSLWSFVMSVIENEHTWFIHCYFVFTCYSQLYSISNNIHTERF